MSVVAALQTFVVEVKAVRVFHDKFATAQQPSARAGFVAILGLNLIQPNGQIFVAAVQIFHQQREHLFMGRAEQVIHSAAVLQAKQVWPIVRPAAGGVVGLTGQQRRKVHLLGADGVHFFAHDVFDALQNAQTQRQPGVSTWGSATDISGPQQQAMTRDFGLGGVVTQCAHKERRQTMNHAEIRLLRRAIMEMSFYVQHECSPQRRGSPPRLFLTHTTGVEGDS